MSNIFPAQLRVYRGENCVEDYNYASFVNRMLAFGNTTDVEINDTKAKKLYKKHDDTTGSSCSTTIYLSTETVEEASKSEADWKTYFQGETKFQQGFYTYAYRSFATAQKGNYLLLARCPWFIEMFRLTQSGKRLAMSIARSKACDPVYKDTYIPKDKDSKFVQWKQFDNDMKESDAAKKATSCVWWEQTVLEEILIPEIAKCVVAPNQVIQAYIDGKASAEYNSVLCQSDINDEKVQAPFNYFNSSNTEYFKGDDAFEQSMATIVAAIKKNKFHWLDAYKGTSNFTCHIPPDINLLGTEAKEVQEQITSERHNMCFVNQIIEKVIRITPTDLGTKLVFVNIPKGGDKKIIKLTAQKGVLDEKVKNIVDAYKSRNTKYAYTTFDPKSFILDGKNDDVKYDDSNGAMEVAESGTDVSFDDLDNVTKLKSDIRKILKEKKNVTADIAKGHRLVTMSALSHFVSAYYECIKMKEGLKYLEYSKALLQKNASGGAPTQNCKDQMTLLALSEGYRNELDLRSKLLPRYDLFTGADRLSWENTMSVLVSTQESIPSKKSMSKNRTSVGAACSNIIAPTVKTFMSIPKVGSSKSMKTLGDVDSYGGSSFLQIDISKYANAGLNLLRQLPATASNKVLWSVVKHTAQRNCEDQIRIGAGMHPVLPASVVHTVLTDEARLMWVSSRKDDTIYVISPHWQLSSTKGKPGSDRQVLKNAVDVYYAKEHGLMPACFNFSNIIFSFPELMKKSCNQDCMQAMNGIMGGLSSLTPPWQAVDPRTAKAYMLAPGLKANGNLSVFKSK